VFHISIWGLGALFGGVSPPNPPRCDGTGKCSKNGYQEVYEKKSICDSRSVGSFSDERLRIEVQPAQTNGFKMVKCFVKVHFHCIVSNLKRINKISTLPPWKNFYGRPWMHWFRSNSWVIKRGAIWFNSFKLLKSDKCQFP